MLNSVSIILKISSDIILRHQHDFHNWIPPLEGHIPFKATCEGQVTKPQHPDHYITFEDDSQSSEGAPSPQLESRSSDVLETAAASAGIVTVSLSIPTTGGAVVVSSTSPVFQQTSTESTIQTFAELCNTVVGTQQQQIQQSQQHTSTQVSLAQEQQLMTWHTRVLELCLSHLELQ